MHTYLPHLLADIAAAHRIETAVQQKPPLSFEEEMAEIERWCEGEESGHTFGYYCGLESVNFPPPEQFTIKETKQVIKAFSEMMYSWNIDISLPKRLPIRIAYAITVDTLNSKTAITDSGFMTFDFCSGYAPDCLFKEYCPCLEIWKQHNEEDDLTDQSTYENPF